MRGAIIVAAGTGERFGRTDGKQMAPLAGGPMLAHTLRAFEECAAVDTIVVVCHPDSVEECRELVVRAVDALKVAAIVPGGPTRRSAVAAGLAVLPRECDIVAVHDGARPLIEPGTIESAFGLLESSSVDGVVVGHPVVDTLKMTGPDARIAATVDRSGLWVAQTPQVFRTDALKRAHARAEESGREATDDAALVEDDGGAVVMLRGPRWNLKVTVPEDLEVAEALLSRRAGKGGPQ